MRLISTRTTHTHFVICLTCFFLAAFNDASAATHYVWQDSPSPTPPYTNWASASHVIQNAVDAAVPGDTIYIAPGIYVEQVNIAQKDLTLIGRPDPV